MYSIICVTRSGQAEKHDHSASENEECMISDAEYSCFRDAATAPDVQVRHERYNAVECAFFIGRLYTKSSFAKATCKIIIIYIW